MVMRRLRRPRLWGASTPGVAYPNLHRAPPGPPVRAGPVLQAAPDQNSPMDAPYGPRSIHVLHLPLQRHLGRRDQIPQVRVRVRARARARARVRVRVRVHHNRTLT